MAQETVIIGCKLPKGITLEVGYDFAENGAQIKGPNYKRIPLKGWHAHTEEMRRGGIQVPAGVNMRPYLNRGVDKAAWDEWKAKHKGSWLLKNEILFEAKDEASAALRVEEGAHTPTPFAPLDRSKPGIPGIAPADFAKAGV